jgi:hypothetical protein
MDEDRSGRGVFNNNISVFIIINILTGEVGREQQRAD